MSFLSSFESKQDGVNDTVEFVIRVAIVTLSAVILVVVLTLAVGLFMPNDLVDSAAILEMVNPAFQTIIGAFVGLLGGLSLNANVRDAKPEEPAPVEPEPAPEPMAPPPAPVVAPEPELELTEPVEDDDDDDDLEPWEKYRNDLRYDANGDGVVDELDFPDWRSAGK
jgi:type IV secretory pathway VirB10-like protein